MSHTQVRGSDKMLVSYQGQIWGTCLQLCGPSLWITINPCDIHDSILQVFSGEEINMDKFNCELGPDGSHCAFNVAHDPYTAAKYFFFIVNTILHTLFHINATNSQVHSQTGLLGHLTTYFGVVEVQG